MDLIRKIIIATEENADPAGLVELDIEGHSSEELSYHVKLLAEAGLIEAEDLSGLGEFCWTPKSLTWSGHEFLDAARNDTVWTKTKDLVREKGGSLPFEIIKSLVIKI